MKKDDSVNSVKIESNEFNVNLNTITETQLDEIQKKLNEKKKELKNQRKIQVKDKIYNKLKFINENEEIKDFILKNIQHNRTSCSDKNIVNGITLNKNDKPTYRCKKCVLLEMLERQMWDDFDYEFDFNFDINLELIDYD